MPVKSVKNLHALLTNDVKASSANNYKLCIRSVVRCDSQAKLNKTANKHCCSVLIIGDSEFSLM